jgi:hypothetical protein
LTHDQLAQLQIEELRREADKRHLAKLAADDRSKSTRLTLRQRIDRSRRRLLPAD